MKFRDEADQIVSKAIQACLPDQAVKNALKQVRMEGRKAVVVAVGKAAWQMAHTAAEELGDRYESGIVITKYGHSKGPIPRMQIFEAGHPVPDENSFAATEQVLNCVRSLDETYHVLFLLSGGGSALFEKPLVSIEELQDVTKQLLAAGCNIVEINTIRKRLSAVKGGRFGAACAPAHVTSVVLSDVLGDPLDMIASGPAILDQTTCAEALQVVEQYNLRISDSARELLQKETPKQLQNADAFVVGGVSQLCQAAADACRQLGYEPQVLTTVEDGEARTVGEALAKQALELQKTATSPMALLIGGETVVHLSANPGMGGRNQELALAAAETVAGNPNTAVFSFGSDGTDGPTDAAGGFVDGNTAEQLRNQPISISQALNGHDAYHCLQQCGGLIITGPTGTNVNDLSVALIRPNR